MVVVAGGPGPLSKQVPNNKGCPKAPIGRNGTAGDGNGQEG